MDETARLFSQLQLGKAFSDEDKENIPPSTSSPHQNLPKPPQMMTYRCSQLKDRVSMQINSTSPSERVFVWEFPWLNE